MIEPKGAARGRPGLEQGIAVRTGLDVLEAAACPVSPWEDP